MNHSFQDAYIETRLLCILNTVLLSLLSRGGLILRHSLWCFTVERCGHDVEAEFSRSRPVFVSGISNSYGPSAMSRLFSLHLSCPTCKMSFVSRLPIHTLFSAASEIIHPHLHAIASRGIPQLMVIYIRHPDCHHLYVMPMSNTSGIVLTCRGIPSRWHTNVASGSCEKLWCSPDLANCVIFPLLCATAQTGDR